MKRLILILITLTASGLFVNFLDHEVGRVSGRVSKNFEFLNNNSDI